MKVGWSTEMKELCFEWTLSLQEKKKGLIHLGTSWDLCWYKYTYILNLPLTVYLAFPLKNLEKYGGSLSVYWAPTMYKYMSINIIYNHTKAESRNQGSGSLPKYYLLCGQWKNIKVLPWVSTQSCVCSVCLNLTGCLMPEDIITTLFFQSLLK